MAKTKDNEDVSPRTELVMPKRLKRACIACARSMDDMALTRWLIDAAREKLEKERRKGRKFDDYGYKGEE